jgi:hypothetical protein
MIKVTVKVSQDELNQIIGKNHPKNAEYAQALAQDVVDKFLNSEYIDPETIEEWFERQQDSRVSEEEILDRVSNVLSETLSREEFVEEINRILGTTYTVEDVVWTE